MITVGGTAVRNPEAMLEIALRAEHHAAPRIFQTPPGMRWCNDCAEWIDKSQFTTKRDSHDGLDNRCNACKARQAAKRRLEDAITGGRPLWRWSHKAEAA